MRLSRLKVLLYPSGVEKQAEVKKKKKKKVEIVVATHRSSATFFSFVDVGEGGGTWRERRR